MCKTTSAKRKPPPLKDGRRSAAIPVSQRKVSPASTKSRTAPQPGGRRRSRPATGPDLLPVPLRAGEAPGVRRRDHQYPALLLQSKQLLPALVIALRPGPQAFQKDGVFAVHPPEQGHQLLRLLPIAPLPGQDNHHPVAATASARFQGMASEQPRPDRGRRHPAGWAGTARAWRMWPGAGGSWRPAGGPPGTRPAGLQVGDHRLHLTGIRLEGVVIKGHQLVGDGVVGELQPEVAAIPGIKEIPPAMYRRSLA